MDINRKETIYFTLHIEEGILHCYYKKIDVLDIDVAKIGVRDRIEFSNNVSYPCLFDIRETNEITKDARDYLAKEGNELVTASAIVVSSAILRVIANFFIKVNRPVNPTRLFTDRETAVEWLKEFRQEGAISYSA